MDKASHRLDIAISPDNTKKSAKVPRTHSTDVFITLCINELHRYSIITAKSKMKRKMNRYEMNVIE